MRNIFIIGLLMFVVCSCDKEGDSYDLSRETVFATFEYDDFVTVPLGGTFELDAVAKEGENVLPVNVDGSVDFNKIGVYEVNYSAKNSDGYFGSVTQTIVVYNPDGNGVDVSGNINDIGRPSRTGIITLVEGTPNIYYCTDMAFGGVFPLYFEMNGTTMNVFNQQPYKFSVKEVNGSYNADDRTFFIDIVTYGFTYNFEYTN